MPILDTMPRRFFVAKLVKAILTAILPLLTMGILSAAFIRYYIKEYSNTVNHKLLYQMMENIELTFKEIDHLQQIYDINNNIGFEMDRIFSDRSTTYERNQRIKMIESYMAADISANPLIHSIYIYYDSFRDRFFSSDYGVQDIHQSLDRQWLELYKDIAPGSGVQTYLRYVRRYAFEEQGEPVITLISPMLTRRGALVLNIWPEYLNDTIAATSLYTDQMIYILNSEGDIVFQSNNADSSTIEDIFPVIENEKTDATIRMDGQQMTVHMVSSERFGLHYVSVIPQNSLYQILNRITELLFLLLTFSFVLCVFTAFLATRQNQKKLRKIVNTLNRAKDFTAHSVESAVPKDEYDYILNHIIQNFLEQDYLKVLLSEKKYRLRSMELLALQSQINPHFLFNTLKTIYWKAVSLTGSQNEAAGMVENLSAILDYSLSSAKDDAFISEEVRMAECYLNIQNIRYRNKFKVIWDIQPEVLSYPVMKLLLQPILENSIYHGIREKEGMSKIKIKAFIRKNEVHISVIDTGMGLSRERLLMVRKAIEGEYTQEHIGLQNTYKRLGLRYENKAGLKIFSKEGIGTAVQIWFSLEKI